MREPTHRSCTLNPATTVKRPDLLCEQFGRRRALIAAGVIVAVGLAVYANSFAGVFLFDDTHAIVENANIRRLWPLWEAIGSPPSRALVNLSLAINYAVGQYDVWGYHAFNLTVHIAAAWALFGVVRRTLTSAPLHEKFGRASAHIAVICALIWLVHPLQTQGVTYIIQRAEAMMGLLYLLCLYCAIRGFGSDRPCWWYAASVLTCTAGMATKPVMVTAPLIVLLYDRTFVAGSFKDAVRTHWRLHPSLAATWVVLAALLWLSPAAQTAGFTMERITSTQYTTTQFGVVLHYIKLAFWPSELVLDYDWPVAKKFAHLAPQAFAILALLAVTLWALWRRPAVGFAGAWFFGILSPTSSIMPIADVAFEHRMYLPLAGIVTLSVACGYRAIRYLADVSLRSKVASKTSARLVGFALTATAIVALGWGTIHRNRDYYSATGMWEDVTAKRPDNARAHYGLAVAQDEQGRADKAIASYRKAISLKPNYADAHNNLAVLLAERGEMAQAADHYAETVRLKPAYPKGHFNLGLALVKLGKFDRAIASYKAGLKLAPNDPVAHNNLGAALERKGEGAQAIAYYAKAAEINPRYVEAHMNLAQTLVRLGRTQEAMHRYKEALLADPGEGRAHFHLALLAAKANRPSEAIRHYRSAIKLNTDWAAALNNLAWILSTSPSPALRDGMEAVRLAERACQLTADKQPRMLITLGATYAETGQFDRAMQALDKAARIAAETDDKNLPVVIEAHLRLYKSHRPYRHRSGTPQKAAHDDNHNPDQHRAAGDQEHRKRTLGGQ